MSSHGSVKTFELVGLGYPDVNKDGSVSIEINAPEFLHAVDKSEAAEFLDNVRKYAIMGIAALSQE